MAKFHKTIGIDMVAHSCNDVLCQGAKPITFLDYIAVDKLDPNHIQEVVDGICEGCREADLPLMGGELAELPGVYKEGEYDLVGVVAGVVEKDKIVDGSKIAPGNTVLGLASSGLHTNGFSLARNVLFNIKKLKVDQYMRELECTLGEILLKPHINYTKPVLSLLDEFDIKGIAHITGGGLVDNILRVLPENCQVMVSKDSWNIPTIFQLIQRYGNVPEDDMFKTFNMGIGLVLMVSQNETNVIASKLNSQGFPVTIIGKVKEGEKKAVISE
jgi:phosphoribosylformylglycinamidine cyclo-ligase